MDKITEGTAEPKKAKKEKKPVDPKVLEALKAKRERHKAERFAARDKVIEFLKTYGDEDVKKFAVQLWPNTFNGRKVGAAVGARAQVSAKDFLLSLFPAGIGSTKSGLDIFNEHNFGPAEMRGKMIRNLKMAEPADRVWVSYNYVDKVYTLVAVGPDMPEGWTGYRPVDLEPAL